MSHVAATSSAQHCAQVGAIVSCGQEENLDQTLCKKGPQLVIRISHGLCVVDHSNMEGGVQERGLALGGGDEAHSLQRTGSETAASAIAHNEKKRRRNL
jgi:hypothetical protein